MPASASHPEQNVGNSARSKGRDRPDSRSAGRRWRRRLSRSAPLLLLCALLWCAKLGELWQALEDANGIDFYDYYTVSRAIGHEPVRQGWSIYSPDTRARLGDIARQHAETTSSRRQLRGAGAFPILEPTSSPYTYSVWKLISSRLPYDRAYLLVQAVATGAFVCALFGLSLMLGHSLGVTALLGLVVSENSLALASDVRVCNVNRLLLCGLSVFLWLQSRAHAAKLTRHEAADDWQVAIGAWMVCLVAFKPVVGSLLAVTWLALLLRGQLRDAAMQVVGGVLGGAFTMAIAAPHFGGVGAWTRWLSSITTTLSDDVTTVELGNYAPLRVLETFWPDVAFRTYTTVASTLLLVALAIRLQKFGTRPQRRLSVVAHVRRCALLLGIGFAFTLATSRLAWLHWQLLLTPCILALAPTQPPHNIRDWGRGLLWLFGLGLLSNDALRPFIQIDPPLGTACAIIAADAVVAALCYAELWSLANKRRSKVVALHSHQSNDARTCDTSQPAADTG